MSPAQRPRLLSEDLLRGLERLTLRTRAASGLSPIGEHPGRLRSSSAEFAESRPYTSGDDFRRIDWNVFARLDVLHVKLNEARETAGLSLLVDCSESMTFGQPTKTLLANEIARGLAYIGLNQLDDVRVFGFGAALLARSPLYRGRGHSHEAFAFLDALPVAEDSDVERSLDAFISQTTQPGVVIVLSDLLSATDTPRALRRLVSLGFEVTVMHLLSQEEIAPDLVGDLELIDSETGERQPVSLTPAALDGYRQDVQDWRRQISADCARLGVRYIPVENDQSLTSLFLVTFRQHGLVDG